MSTRELLARRRVSVSWVFREAEYVVSCSVRDDVLEVEVEETVSTNQWKGRFEAKHVEELTRKTGNFKQFLVFVTMLESAINKSSECVTLDLLTYADLEALRERKNGSVRGQGKPSASTARSAKQQQKQQQSQAKRYLILTYSVEFDRIHYPLALPYTGQADSAQLRDTIRRLATELETHKRLAAQGKRNTALARLQKDYDALLQEKEALEEEVESLQTQLQTVREEKSGKQLRMLQKVVRNLEEEVLQERSKHQRYVNKKTEEMRALMQELGELRSSERTLQSRVKNITNELSVLKRGLRSSPSTALRPRQSPSSSSHSFKKTSITGSGGSRWRSNSGSLERRQRSERRTIGGYSGTSRMRTPSPRGGRMPRFNPSTYVENKRRQQKESDIQFQRLRSPSYRGRGAARSRSSSVEKSSSSNRCPVPGAGSRRLWGSTESLKGTRKRSSSVESLSGQSSRRSSAASSRVPSRRPSLTNLSDIEPSPSSGRGRAGRRPADERKRRTDSAHKPHSSTPASAKGSGKKNGSLLDHSAEMSEIDARLNALQQFMKRSLETSKSQSKR